MTIKLGIPVSLTGQFSLQGAQTLAGIRAWAGDVNRADGMNVGGRKAPVQVVWRDDGSRRDNVRVITEGLIAKDKVDLLIGPYSAVLTNAAAEVAQARGKLLWNQGGASPLVYQRGNPWVVGILTPADEYLAGLLPAVREVCPDAATVAIARASTGAFPRDVAAGVERAADALGFRVAPPLQFDAEADDFREIVSEVRRAAPDVLVVAGRFQNDLRIAESVVPAFAGMTGGPPPGAVAVVAAGVDAFRERLGAMAENFIGPSQWEPDAGYSVDYGPTESDVRASLQRIGHPVIDYPMAQAYAVGVVIQRCVEECGSLDDATRCGKPPQHWISQPSTAGSALTPTPDGPLASLPCWCSGRQGGKCVVWPPEHRTETLAYPWR